MEMRSPNGFLTRMFSCLVVGELASKYVTSLLFSSCQRDVCSGGQLLYCNVSWPRSLRTPPPVTLSHTRIFSIDDCRP